MTPSAINMKRPIIFNSSILITIAPILSELNLISYIDQMTTRTEGINPYQVIGVDFAGPLAYRLARQREGKAYVLPYIRTHYLL